MKGASVSAFTFHFSEAVRAVDCAIAGLSVDGGTPLPFEMAFTDDREVQLAIATHIHAVVLCAALQEKHVQPLTLKMMQHYSATGLQSVQALDKHRTPQMMMAIINTLNKHPNILDTEADIARSSQWVEANGGYWMGDFKNRIRF